MILNAVKEPCGNQQFKFSNKFKYLLSDSKRDLEIMIMSYSNILMLCPPTLKRKNFTALDSKLLRQLISNGDIRPKM